MDKSFLEKVKKDKEVKFDDIPDDFDISTLPDDVEIIFEEDFPDLEDSFWEEDEK